MRNIQRILTINLKRMGHLEDIGENGEDTLKCILKK
jgi:hypothetical protein